MAANQRCINKGIGNNNHPPRDTEISSWTNPRSRALDDLHRHAEAVSPRRNCSQVYFLQRRMEKNSPLFGRFKAWKKTGGAEKIKGWRRGGGRGGGSLLKGQQKKSHLDKGKKGRKECRKVDGRKEKKTRWRQKKTAGGEKRRRG